MKVSLFKNISEPKNPEILDLIDYLFDNRDGKWEDIVSNCRNMKTKDERDIYKQTMPTACFSGSFSYRNDQSLVTHSEIIAMDLDEVENLNSVKNQLKKDKYVFSVFMSTSGFGLRVLFKIEPNKHKEAFKGLCQYLYEQYGLTADRNSSISKPYVVSFDPDLWLSPEYSNVPIFKKYVKETEIKNIPVYIHNDEDFENVYKQIIARRIDICQDYDDWMKLGFGLAESFGDKGRYYFHELSKVSEKYVFSKCDKQYTYFLKHKTTGDRINIKTFYYLAKINGINIVTERTKEIVRITRNGKKAGLKPQQISNNLKEKGGIEGSDDLVEKIFHSQEKDGFEDADESILSVLEMFLSNTYNMKFNEISGFFENDGKQVTPTDMNSIFISAKRIIPKLDYGLMIRLLKSDFVKCYNPIYDFFGSDGIPVILPPMPIDNGVNFESPIIDRLAETIINDRAAFTRYFLRKWLISIVSSAHKIHSPLLFCLLGAQHTGKTEFFRRLMPKQLLPYYAESKLDKETDDEILMTENLVIMDDELGGKSKADALKLKNITSKQYFSLRRPYGEHNEKILRLAVLCGTSNYKQILSDPTGNRRIIPTEVTDINKELFNDINKKDLFMEMFNLYKAGFDWRVVPADLKLLNQDEEKFTVIIKERELLMTYFEPGDTERLSSTDILIDLERLTQQKLNVNVLGRELGDMGFNRKSTRYGTYNERVRQMWCINKINRSFSNSQQPGFKPINEKDENPF